MSEAELEQRAVNVIRGLAMDAVQRANSGHPGTPMALAPLAHVLFSRVMRYTAADADWPDRDRFVLSAGHACVLQYSALHLSGYNLSLEELKRFRQWQSATPGHPEYRHTEGVEVTTGPLGQGFANGVGMAFAGSGATPLLCPTRSGGDRAVSGRRTGRSETGRPHPIGRTG